MMKKMMKLWMHLIVFAAFTSAYANQVDCDFEKDSCSWSIEGFRRISDNQFSSTDEWYDNMHRSGSEWFLLFDAANESYATLRSVQATIEGLQCLNFWYIFRGSRESQIQVLVQGIDGDNVSAIWETSMLGTGWRRATVEIDVQYSSMVTILIRGRTGRSYSKIGIDDIVLKLASCLDCNFQDGLCSWNGEGWNVPTKVNYAVTELKSMREDSVLTSAFDIYPGEKCLSFKYQMKDFKSSCIFIEVHSLHNNSWCPIWKSQSQHTLQGWNEISVTINVEHKSKITIRFLHSNCFSVTYYINSISLKKQSCTATDSFSSTLTTVSTSTSTETNATNSCTNTITTANTNETTNICTTAGTTINASPMEGPTIIGFISLVVAVVFVVVLIVVLVAVCCCRRKKQSNSGTNVSMNNTGLYETHNELLSQDNYDQIIRVTSGRENNIMDRVYNNEEPEYLQIEE